MRQQVGWLKSLSIPGVCKLLKRLQVSYQRGREHISSPDRTYEQKLILLALAKRLVQLEPERFVLLYEDEHTYCRNPSVSWAYAQRGGPSPTAKHTPGSGTKRRVAGCLDWRTGRLITRQRSSFTVKEMARFLRFVEAHYPKADLIYIALDNWPVHFHPYVLDELAKHHSRIQLLRLPTYAPWTNPIEKVWRKFNQEVAHMHPWSANWSKLKERATEWFQAFEQGSLELLHYVGLAPHFKRSPIPNLIC